MGLTQKIFLNYSGSTSIGHLVVFQTGLTLTSGIVVDIADEADRPLALISEMSAQALENIKSLADFNVFASYDLSLIDHPLHKVLVADLRLLPISRIAEFLRMCQDVSDHIEDIMALNDTFLGK